MAPESRLIREQRARQQSEADIVLVEAVIEVLPDILPELLIEAFKHPQVRTSILNIVAAQQKQASPKTSGVNSARGGRRG